MNYNFKDKTTNINNLNRYMLAKTLSMFEYDGLPDTIPAKELEKLLQINGYAFITEVDGELYVFNGGLGGEPDMYYNPTEITINNPHLKFNATLSLSDDGVIFFNDVMQMGLIPLFTKHNTMLVENDINMVLYGYATRMKTVISASDDRTKESAEDYLNKVVNGEVGIIGENMMFDGIKVQTAHSSQGGSVSTLIEYHQYIKGSLYNEVGLSANFNMKKERLITSEIDQQNDGLYPLVYNMLEQRKKAVELLNEKYGLNVSVSFGSVWDKADRINNHEQVDEPKDEPIDEQTDEPIDEPIDEPTDEQTDEPKNEQLQLLDDMLNDDLSPDDVAIIEDLKNELGSE